MNHISICIGVMCSVYTFGSSARVCPGCGEKGKKMSPEQCTAFALVYREVQVS